MYVYNCVESECDFSEEDKTLARNHAHETRHEVWEEWED
jgi:hypothetical protein